MTAKTLEVQVVNANGVVWGGKALSILARTVEGDVGILPGHEPFLAVLVPCAGEVLTLDGSTEIVAIDSGFVSVSENHVSILAPHAAMLKEINMDEAERNLAKAEKLIDAGHDDDETMTLYYKSLSHVKAVQKARAIR